MPMARGLCQQKAVTVLGLARHMMYASSSKKLIGTQDQGGFSANVLRAHSKRYIGKKYTVCKGKYNGHRYSLAARDHSERGNLPDIT